MRKFTKQDIEFIINNEAKITLGRFAEIFNCHWKEIYRVYDIETRKPEYKARYDRMREVWERRTEKNRARRLMERAECFNGEERKVSVED